MGDERFIGRQVATFRRMRGLSQQQLADLAGGVSRQYISMIEAGRRPVDKRETLYALCRALSVSVSDLTGEPFEPVDRLQVQARAGIPAIEQALMARGDALHGLAPRGIAELEADAEAVLRLRMQAEYAELTRLLPGLLSELSVYVDSDDEDVQVRALRALLRAVFACSMGVKEMGFTSLAWIAAQTAEDTARKLGESVPVAAATFLRSQNLLSAAVVDGALRVARGGVEALQPYVGDEESLELYGMLNLQAALAATAAARQDPSVGSSHLDAARAHLEEARQVAARTGEGQAFELCFGPANVGIWELSIAIEQDEPGRVGELATGIDPSSISTPHRLSRYYIEQGRAYARSRRPSEALAMLLRAENVAPQHVRTRPVVRELVGFMVRDARRQAVSDRLGGLARRCGVAPVLA